MSRSTLIAPIFCLLISIASGQDADSIFSSPGRLGIGIRGGIVHFSGDVRDALDFEGARTPFHAGIDLLIHARLYQAKQGNNAMRLGLEFAGGYRTLAAHHSSYAFITRAWPASASFTIEFYAKGALRPFVNVGVGAMPYRLNILRNEITDPKRKSQIIGSPYSSVAFWIPLRVGLRYALSSWIDLHAAIERSVTLTDRLDGIETSELSWLNDNFEFLSLGFTYYLPTHTTQQQRAEQSDPYGEEIFVQQSETRDDASRDSDGDSLTDRDEQRIYKTDPNNKDTDGDGLTDGDEVRVYKTNPLLNDTDGDGISDGEEIRLGTNPLNRDTDGDGISDATDRCPKEPETKNGYQDEDGCPDDAPTSDIDFRTLGQVMILQNVEFELGKAVLLPESFPILDKVVASMKTDPRLHFEIRGHTDSTGNFEQNMKLSLQRAESVRQYIISKGIEENRLAARGFGSTSPIAPNATTEGRQRNRRIEFKIIRIDE